VSLSSWKSRKFQIFGKNFKSAPKGKIPLSDFYKIRREEREFEVRTLAPNFTIVVLDMW